MGLPSCAAAEEFTGPYMESAPQQNVCSVRGRLSQRCVRAVSPAHLG